MSGEVHPLLEALEGRPFAEAALFLADRLGVLPWFGRADGPIHLTDTREEIR